MLIIASAMLAALLLPSCKEKSESAKNPNEKALLYGITIVDNAALRLEPLVYSARITQIQKGDKVEIIEKSKEKTSVGNSTNYWYKVKISMGITGWLYGGNLKIFKVDDAGSIDKYVSVMREEEEAKLKKVLSGRWWSVDYHDEFTNHGLEIYEDGKYVSYMKGGDKIKGDFNINFAENEIVFLSNTSFGKNLKFIKRGNIYYLETLLGGWKFRFKRIVEEITEKDDEKTIDKIINEPDSGEPQKDKNK